MEKQTWSAVAHDGANLLTSFRLKAMHAAIGAKILRVLPRAVLNAVEGIRNQFGAFGTKSTSCSIVVTTTIKSDHGTQGSGFFLG